MNAQYEAFCVADPRFYDTPGADEPGFSIAARALPDGWTRARLGPWTVLRPPRTDLPPQGWKVHVAACLGNAEHILARVWEHCTSHGVTFKFLAGPTVHLLRNSKYAAREGSGKLVAIYPGDERELQRVCEELGAELAGQPGPYILSDLRLGAGPLHVRYGAFTERLCPGPAGDLVPAVERPDGTLVPDPRRPVFAPPDWVELPAFLQPHLEVGAGAMPYPVTRALHFSNGGGVYVAQREGEPPVVLKEARPHAGLDRHGADAVTRLAHEADILDRLDGIDGIPRLRERFTVWEHHYLAMEHVEGTTLGQWMARNHPLTRCDPGPAEIAGYTDRAVTLLERIEQLLAAVHARGIVYGDLHPRNVLVGADDRVSLVDFELASPLAAPVRPGLGAAGFTAPADRSGTGIDRYALAALRLFLFLPLGAVLALEPGKLTGYLADIERRFPVPPGFTEAIRRELAPAGRRAATPPARLRDDWPAARDSLVAAVLDSASPARRDRLFPGDVAQFTTGGLGLAHGAAGVLHALDAVGAGRFPAHEQWLVDAAAAAPPRRAGLYDGAAGLAWLLQRFGHHDAASGQLVRLLDALPRIHDTSLFRGVAGIGTALLDLAELRGDPQLATHAVALGDRAAAALGDRAAALGDRAVAARVPRRPARAGLMHGWSGPAVFFLALHRETGDEAWLERAEAAVRRDLDECVRTADGTRQVSDPAGRRTLPYLDTGSAGIAVALARLVTVRPQTALAGALPELVRACELEFVIQPGLLAGRAGLITALAAVRGSGRGGDRVTRALGRHLDRLDWHAVRHRGRLAFPGDHLLRLSMDLATGSAGVLLAASAALDDHRGDTALLPGVPTAATAVAAP